jgi:hypothetical protein
VHHIGHVILPTKSLGAIQQSTSQGGTRKQGDLYGQGWYGVVGSQEKDTFPLHSGEALLLIQEGMPRYNCSSWLPVHRVKGPRVEDWEKLSKLLGYLRRTVDFVMRLKPSALFCVVAYIDASFLAHQDGKLHSSIAVKVGEAPVFFDSRKLVRVPQK